MENTKSRYMLGTNYTMPASGKNWKNFFVDRKNSKAVNSKYRAFSAKRDLEMGLISETDYKLIMKELFGKKTA